MLREKETYGILLVDASDATIATLQGKRLNIVRQMYSGVSGKTRAGGQSARRYERLRDMQLNEYFTRVGAHADEIFLPIDTPERYNPCRSRTNKIRLRKRRLPKLPTKKQNPRCRGYRIR